MCIRDRYSDRVQRGEPSHLIFEISTVSHLFGGESALLQTVADQMASLGHHCMLAIADDPHVAFIWSQWGDGGVIPSGASALYLAELPFIALGASDELTQSMRTLGIATIAQWRQMDAASIAGRYGAEGVRLHRLARGEVLCKGLQWFDQDSDLTESVDLPEAARQWALICLLYTSPSPRDS